MASIRGERVGPRRFSKTDVVLGINQDERLRRIRQAATTRPAVPNSTAAVAAAGDAEVGIFGFLGNVITTGLGVVEAVTGRDIPLVGPGDRFFGGGGGGGAPGGAGPLDVQGLPQMGLAPSGGGGPCFFPFERDAFGKCVPPFIGTAPGPDPSAGVSLTGGRQLHGRIGADLHSDHMPTVVRRNVRDCGRGFVLGVDGICHPKKSLRNSERWYPKPRRPLGTAGDLNAVTKAKAFSKRLVNNQKSLRETAKNFEKASRTGR